MRPWNHWRSAVIWGFGMIQKATGRPTAEGAFCFLVVESEGSVARYCCGKGYSETGMEYMGASASNLGRHE